MSTHRWRGRTIAHYCTAGRQQGKAAGRLVYTQMEGKCISTLLHRAVVCVHALSANLCVLAPSKRGTCGVWTHPLCSTVNVLLPEAPRGVGFRVWGYSLLRLRIRSTGFPPL